MANGLKFDGKNLIIELKETFKALQNVKKSVKIEHINDNLINTSNPIISTKNDDLKPSFVNGAGGGIVLDFVVSRTSDLLHFVAANLCPLLLEFARYCSATLLHKIRRTHRKRVLILTTFNKKANDKSHRAFYGASNGIRFEPYCVKFAHLCLHEEETIEQVKEFLINCNNS